MNKNYLIAISAYKEDLNIINLIKKIREEIRDITILIINDNSGDKTKIMINELYDDSLIYLERPKKLGLGTAHKLSIFYAIKHKFKFLITMDADLSHDPKELNKIVDSLLYNPFVLGSRYIAGGKCLMKGSRLILSYFGNKLIKIISGIKSNEFTTSYRGFNMKNLKNFNLNNVHYKGYSFFMGTIFELYQNNILIKEIPIIFKDRSKGVSKIPKFEMIRTFINLVIFFVKKNF